MAENGVIFKARQQLIVLHTHLGTPLNDKAVQVTRNGEIVGVMHELSALIPGLAGMIGHTSYTGALSLPDGFVHKDAQNVTFRSPKD